MKKGLFFVWLFLVVATNNLVAQKTETLMLTGNSTDDGVTWDFFCTSGRNSGEWSKIRVPSCWELEGFGTYNYGYEKNTAAEKGLYRTTFSIPGSWKDKRVFIVFEGSMTDTKVEVNGQQAGDVHQGSFYRFKREITDLVEVGPVNQLEVEVSKLSSNSSVNSAERNADFWIFGGVFRPVYLEAVPKTFIEYVGIDAKHDGSINLEVNMDKEVADATILAEIFETETGRKVGALGSVAPESGQKLLVKGFIADIAAWTAESPHLYYAEISLKQKGKSVHLIKERFGFRSIEVRERDGVYINNQKIRFKGVNRHCFWPSTGRSVSFEQSLGDVLLIKEMNMNAVRASHYPPDKHFLELCDSLGLYVINELCAWQKPAYDTSVGTILVNEMVKRDLNHPSVVFWANGNEGGFNRDFDPLFVELDTQKRPVIHPFGLFGGINTVHYISYNSGIKNMFNGREVFMPTELLHGLYDGGHGAGLDDYWNLMLTNPLSAGLFLWDFSDQGVVRTDKEGVLDTDKASGADGILGPYREKEGSFYTIKEIWSPVFVVKKYITPQWNGVFAIENRFDFTNTKACYFSYVLKRFGSVNGDVDEVAGSIIAPAISPGGKGQLNLAMPDNWQAYDVLYLTARDPEQNELFTWSFELNSPAFFAHRVLNCTVAPDRVVEMMENDSLVVLRASGIAVKISKINGLLKEVDNGNGIVPLSEGPVFISDEDVTCKAVEVRLNEGKYQVEAVYHYSNNREAYRFNWTMNTNGVLQLDYSYRPRDKIVMSGVTFSFPEKGVSGASLFANGPYRVYNNRLKGGTLGVWEKEYNDAITGEVWEYPEFKGYYSLFYGMKLFCPTPFEVYSTSEDVFLHLFTPSVQQQYDVTRNYTNPPYPTGNISFLDAIPPVGTKFQKAENFGPQSQLHRFKGFSESPDMVNRLYFRFRD